MSSNRETRRLPVLLCFFAALMLAIAPNYSGRPVLAAGAGGEGEVKSHDFVVDDFDKAKEVAIESKRKLLLNFTGVT